MANVPLQAADIDLVLNNGEKKKSGHSAEK